MDLSPEEKEKIYQQEKARAEARDRIKSDAQTKNFTACFIVFLALLAVYVFFTSLG